MYFLVYPTIVPIKKSGFSLIVWGYITVDRNDPACSRDLNGDGLEIFSYYCFKK